MYPEMLYDREKPRDPVTLDIYPFGRTSFTMYEDDGTTQEYRQGAFAKTLIEVDAPKAIEGAGAQILVKVNGAKGTYKDMPASRAYLVDVHVPSKPASVALVARVVPEPAPAKLAGAKPAGRGAAAAAPAPIERTLPVFDAAAAPDRASRDKVRAAFNAADRRGVLHVKVKPQPLAAGFTIKIGM
jgi:hypothetical protein